MYIYIYIYKYINEFDEGSKLGDVCRFRESTRTRALHIKSRAFSYQLAFSEPRSYWWWSTPSLFEAVLIGAEVIKRWPTLSLFFSFSFSSLIGQTTVPAVPLPLHPPANERTLLWEMAASWLITRSSPNLGVQPRRRKVVGEIPVGASERESERSAARWSRARVYRRVRERPRFFSRSLSLSLSLSLVLVGAQNALVPNIRCRMDPQSNLLIDHPPVNVSAHNPGTRVSRARPNDYALFLPSSLRSWLSHEKKESSKIRLRDTGVSLAS